MTVQGLDWDRERREVVEVTYRYAAGIDRHDWTMLRSCFTEQFEYDLSSWNGTPPATRSADDFVAAVRATNGGFDATQHLITNHLLERIADDEIRCVAEIRAQHWFSPSTLEELGRAPGPVTWYELGGHYTGLMLRDGDQWRIRHWTLTVRWRTGDESLFELARARRVDRG